MAVIIKTIDPIISDCDVFMQEFITKSLACFKAELELYINKNNDPVVLDYSNERTLASMFVNGLVRKDNDITALQEYGTPLLEIEKNGRPDIFINYQQNAIWIETKIDKSYNIDKKNHWDIESWLLWDYGFAFKQVEKYFDSEKNHLNECFTEGNYIMTLVFKLIEENPEEHFKSAEDHLKNKVNDIFDRKWYYSSFFIENDLGKGTFKGIELYGTFCKKER